ncbi:Angiogenic factor with G patch and FHA domains 1-like Protein [Tribolium castaneum]|uniref:Angiogenic factor with G patch and FHA domains 1-like Protein n=1 Tax=Tribolium castaneum TaxID=7070 RepID=D6WTF7_TRICA|nr:Angiogenic factor with G patch and FHA domains 1-like Protein [Tribolium castaneum]
MSEIIDVDTAESSGTENHVKKYEISASLKEKLRELPEALAYIRLLEKQIRKQKKKLRKLRAKLKVKRHDVGTQTETKSIIEEITEAAELATQNQGFVYDEASGMYYDSNSGYYYNAEYGLYYEPNTGTYMTYKQETNTYEFHSRVHVPREIQKEVVKRKKKSKDESKVNISSDLEHLTSCFNFLTINKLRTYASGTYQ